MKRLVLVVLAACSAAGPVSKPEPVASRRDCERTADHLVQIMLAGIEQKNAAAADDSSGKTETMDQLTRLFIRQCTEMKWSVEAQKCFGAAPSLAATGDCAQYLTVDQRNAADHAIEELFGKPPPKDETGSGAVP